MARPLVTGNGRLLVGFDEHLVLRDLFYPRVGQVNQIAGRRNQIGIWVDGQFAWMGDPGWERHLAYRPGSLVTESRAVHHGLGLELTLNDAVHPVETTLVRHLRVRDLAAKGARRDVRVFAALDFDLEETDVGDTALYDPELAVIFHYKRNRWMLLGARGPQGGIDEYATGRKRWQGAEGTWRDAEDGRLEGHPISQGAVDSTIGLHAPLEPGGAVDLFIWIVCGTDYWSARRGHELVEDRGPAALIEETDQFWRTWTRQTEAALAVLPKRLQEAGRRSLLIIRTQIDNGGAILAANDTDILSFNRDHYSYMWPRDGALVAAALDRAGFASLTRRFYEFCRDGLSPDGFLWHKYNPDGTVGSSWHPWVGPKGVQLPIQEDETALVLWALGRRFQQERDAELIGGLYPTLVRPAADFLVRYRDPETHLPLESYDLWEERRGIFTFTTASVVAGLRAAAELALAVGDREGARRYAAAGAETEAAMLRYLWSEEEQRFLRGIYLRKDGTPVPDTTPESSIMGLFLLDVLPATDPRLEATVRSLQQSLWVKTEIGGIARYYDDYYFRVGSDPSVTPGNPWIICTLWIARWHIARAATEAELAPALELLEWALARALTTGALPEQVQPFTGEPLSVLPLTWSHATLVDTLLDLAEKLNSFSA